jgi:Lhr-like helicase
MCKFHKTEWKNLLPLKSLEQKLKDLDVPFLTEAEHKAGIMAPKKKRKLVDLPPGIVKTTKEWNYNAGKNAAPRAPAKPRAKK